VTLAIAAAVALAHAQDQSQLVRFQGGINLSGEEYIASAGSARRPGSAARAVLTPTVILFDQIQLPFEVFVGTEGKGYRQPFNQFGVNPKVFGWLTLHAGYYSARVSDLTFGDARLYGAGLEATPGIFRFTLLYGRSQRAVSPDTLNGILGAYERWIIAVKLGVGRESSYFFDLNFMHAKDDLASVASPTPQLSPKENAVLSLRFGLPLILPVLSLTGEVGVSALSNDTRAAEFGHVPSVVRHIFSPRLSSQFDAAGKISLNVSLGSVASVRFSGEWVGPGFVTLGYTQLQNDVFDLTAAPALHLLDGKLNLTGTYGKRYNNLRSNRFSTTQRTIGSLGVSSQPTQAFGFDITYTNYGMRSSTTNDTLRIDNVTQSLTVSPRTTFNGLGGVNTVVFSYNFNEFMDYNVVSAATSQNKTSMGTITWSLSLPEALTLSTSLLYTTSAASTARTTVKSLTQTVGHPFFDNKVITNFTLGFNVVTPAASSGQLSMRLTVTYVTVGTISFSLMSNAYNLGGGSATAPSYHEFQASLQYGLSF